MKNLLATVLVLSIAAPAVAEPLPPPQRPALPLPPPPKHLPQQQAPPNEQPQPPQKQPPPQAKNPGKPPEYFKARREALAARKQAQIDRMMQIKAARADAAQKDYEDWHERYLADTPVREQYYRAQANAYLYDAFRPAYYNYYGPPVIVVPIVPVYYAPHDYIYWPW